MDERVLYLCDFELIGFSETGPDLIEKFSLGNNAILVTSHYEEDEIKNRCKKEYIKLIPKMIVAYVPITLKEKESMASSAGQKTSKEIILLDDDPLTRMVWETTAQGKEVNLNIFEFPQDLFDHIDQFAKDTIFYIDSNLSDGQKGEDVALKLFQMGHKNLYLATGYEAEVFEHLDYILGVVGKGPPCWE